MSYWKLRSIALGKKQVGRLQNGEIEMTQDKGQVPAIQRFEVVDCIDSKHVPAVIPKPHGPSVAVALSDDLRDRLVAISEAIADQDDRAAQAMLREILKAPLPSPTPQAPFQQRVQPWLLECFGAEIAADRMERNHRFLEESLELVQSLGCTASEAHQLVGYVFGRPVGDPPQEVGGVMVTLAALCLASGLDMHDAGEVELVRISVPEIVAKIRAKQAAKPKHSPLPQSPAAPAESVTAPAGGAAILKEILAAACCEDSETYLTYDRYRKLYDLQRRIESMPTQPTHAADSVLEDAGGANWQDISTAPKDGTRFVAAGNNYGLDSETQHVCIAQWFRGCWMEASDWNETSELKYLTHWMPLLPLPGNAARKQGGA